MKFVNECKNLIFFASCTFYIVTRLTILVSEKLKILHITAKKTIYRKSELNKLS